MFDDKIVHRLTDQPNKPGEFSELDPEYKVKASRRPNTGLSFRTHKRQMCLKEKTLK